MSISIVIVTFNSSSSIKLLLESLSRSQIKVPTDIIIVDNNSDDRSILLKIIDQYRSKLNIKFVARSRNHGFGDSCNLGAKFAKSLILFLNPDTIVKKDSIQLLYTHMKLNKADIIGGKSLRYHSRSIHRTVFNTPTIKTTILEFCNLGKLLNIDSGFYVRQKNSADMIVDGVGAAYMMIKKTCFKKLGGFDINFFMYLEDVDLCMRAQKIGLVTIYCPHSIIEHVGGASSPNKHKIQQIAWFKSRDYIAKKYFSQPISIIIRSFFAFERALLQIRENVKV